MVEIAWGILKIRFKLRVVELQVKNYIENSIKRVKKMPLNNGAV